jgi:hypothetical protein
MTAELSPKKALAEMEALHESLRSCATSSQRKYRFDKMLAIWRAFPSVRKVWDYLSEARLFIDRFVKKVQEVVENLLPPRMRVEWNGIQPMAKDVNQVYLIRCLDEKKELVYTKVGTTTRDTRERMSEHLSKYAKEGVRFIEVKRLWDCGLMPPDGLESEFRAKYIKKYPHTFQQNDRFTRQEVDYEEADHIAESYLKR